jgi:hypothetical protein
MYYRTVSYTYNVSIITHNRPTLLESAINSVLQAVDERPVPIYVIWQNPEDSTSDLTRKVLDKFIYRLSEIVVQKKKYVEPEANIDAARLEALINAFRDPSIEYAVVIEEDACIAKDTLDFFESAIRTESNKFHFRGINFGSKEEIKSPYGYSRIRYGIHGPVSAISRKTWKHSGLATYGSNRLPRTWDGYIEPYLKTGYMVTPNLSRYIDLGTRGTHANSSNDDYFNGLQKSFDLLSKIEYSQTKYFHQQINHTWRFDSKAYFSLTNPYYYFIFFLKRLRDCLEK